MQENKDLSYEYTLKAVESIETVEQKFKKVKYRATDIMWASFFEEVCGIDADVICSAFEMIIHALFNRLYNCFVDNIRFSTGNVYVIFFKFSFLGNIER